MRFLAPIAAVCLMCSVVSTAQKKTEIPIGGIDSGEGFLQNCPEIHPNMPFEEVTRENYCLGFVRGVLEYNRVLQVGSGLNLFCPPKDLPNADADALLREYIKRHPEHQKMPTAVLIAKAMSEKYACPATNSKPKDE